MAHNNGRSVPDIEAVGPNSETITQWRKNNRIDPSKQIRLVKLSHMRYQHPDLEEITTFMKDFGMQIAKATNNKIWFKGYGADQYVYFAQKGPKEFLGGTFEVESYEDLERAMELPWVVGKIEELGDAPGGGYMLTLQDPEGFPVNLCYGQAAVSVGESQEQLVLNYENEKKRVRRFQRFETGPAAVHKLGHFGLCVQKFDDQLKWYTETFNLVPSDFLHVPANGKEKLVGVFAHIDRGQTYVDHHSFFMTTSKTSHVHHCSFEVHDYDTQHMGHQWLAQKGYESVWGVGRHILGSQIFDYWWDTTGNMVEHYADGDLVNEETPVGYGPAGDESLAVWGPEVPQTFLN